MTEGALGPLVLECRELQKTRATVTIWHFRTVLTVLAHFPKALMVGGKGGIESMAWIQGLRVRIG